MKKDNIDALFERLTDKFDLQEPNENHRKRFLQKLKQQQDSGNTKTFYNWKPLLSIAASIVLLVSLFVFTTENSQAADLASVSPEMQKTQDFFTLTINEELKKLNAEKNPATEHLIEDALKQIAQLESDYQKLMTDLAESGNDQRVIHAMISNFQNRIDILNTVLEQIENVKQVKNNTYENSTTI